LIISLALPKWGAAGIDVTLDAHQHRRLIPHCAGAMSLAAFMLDATLVFAEGKLAGTLLYPCPVHTFDKPAARDHYDPLRRRVLVPFADPPNRLDGKYDGRLRAGKSFVPLRVGVADLVGLVVRQEA
jgi:hypothetical protein